VVEEGVQNPLVLKELQLERDVAWERSLALKAEFVNSRCVITVDGFLLFFDAVEGQERRAGCVLQWENVCFVF
jgi:hypothetical protein